MLRILALAILLSATPAAAQLCDGTNVRLGSDGRALGHLPYGDAAPDALVPVPDGIALRQCDVRAEMLPDLGRLVGAAATAGYTLYALSCHRSIARQAAIFCAEAQTGADDRAISVAPPGHSEHATGFALDFAVRPSPNCPDVEACMAATPAFRWLVANAPQFGFEMSFPVGSRQNVKWEPWHWRWVGATAQAPGAAWTRFLFARARRDFPASPAVGGLTRIAVAVPAPFLALPAAPEDRKGERKKRRRR